MAETLIISLLFLLSLSVVLNLKLTLELQALIKKELIPENQHLELLPGEHLNDVQGHFLSGDPFLMFQRSNASVLVFLSSRCPTCKLKLAEIEYVIPLAQQQNLDLWLISNESHNRLLNFLPSTVLQQNTIRLRRRSYLELNPTEQTPQYVFVTPEKEVQALGEIGDENWSLLLEQLQTEPETAQCA